MQKLYHKTRFSGPAAIIKRTNYYAPKHEPTKHIFLRNAFFRFVNAIGLYICVTDSLGLFLKSIVTNYKRAQYG
jgi:hypothetical protein